MRCDLDQDTAKRNIARMGLNSDPLRGIPQPAPAFPGVLFLLLQNNHNQIIDHVKRK